MSGPIPQPPPEVTVLVVSWNDWPKLQTCLRSIYRTAIVGTEVIVIDNEGTDETSERVREHFPSARLHRNRTNIGHTKAVNQGFLLSRGRYILLLDSDTELLGDCFSRLYSFLEERPEIAVVAPRTFNSDGSIQESARDFPTPLSGLFGRQSMLTRLFPNNLFSRRYLKREFLAATDPFEVEQVGSAAMLFRRDLIERFGPWDERYFAYWVDTDWCRRLRAAGQRIFCVPAAGLRHDEMNARGKRRSVRRIWLFHVGAWRFYTRWYTFGWWDPRSIGAAAVLFSRGALQLVLNRFVAPNAATPAGFVADSGGRGQTQP